METKKIGIYEVTIHDKEIDRNLGDRARVSCSMNYEFEGRTFSATAEIRQQWGPEADPNAKPAYGRGRTLSKHEQSHIDDCLKILKNRQPKVMPPTPSFVKYMDRTGELVSMCHRYHTDGIVEKNNPIWRQCRGILGWEDTNTGNI